MKILIKRKFAGIGDWLFCADVSKMAKLQYPDLTIDISFDSVRNKYPDQVKFIKELYKNIDHGFRYILDSPAENYDVIFEHLVYTIHSRNLLQSIVEVFNQKTKLNVKYDKNNLCIYTGEFVPNIIKDPYIIMSSIGKSRSQDQKELGYENTKQLYHKLSSDYKIIQIGPKTDPLFEKTSGDYLGCDFKTLHSLYMNCKFLVGLVNFNMHWAGRHNIPSYISWIGRENLGKFDYPSTVMLQSQNITLLHSDIKKHEEHKTIPNVPRIKHEIQENIKKDVIVFEPEIITPAINSSEKVIIPDKKEIVGLVIPIHNRLDYLKKFFNSLKRSDLSKINHLVVVDDCSTDIHTMNFIKNFQTLETNNLKVHIFRNNKNLKIYGTLRKYLDYLLELGCTTLSNIDPDSIMNKDWFDSVLKLQEKYPGNLYSTFNTTTKGRHKIIKTNKDHYEKKTIGGIHMLFSNSTYVEAVRPSFSTHSRWDTTTCNNCELYGKKILVTRPSKIQHIGTKSIMGHHDNPDVADDFIQD